MKHFIATMIAFLAVCNVNAQGVGTGVPSVSNVLKILEIVSNNNWKMPDDKVIEELGMKFISYSRTMDSEESFCEYEYCCGYNASRMTLYNEKGACGDSCIAKGSNAMILTIGADTSCGAELQFFNKADADSYWAKILEYGLYADEYGSKFICKKRPGKGIHVVKDYAELEKLKPITMPKEPEEPEWQKGMYVISLALDF